MFSKFRPRRPRRPSHGTVVAYLALFVALGGTAFAGPIAQLAKTVSGDSVVKKRTLSGNRLRKDTVTGTEVKENTLGQVPKANQANSAGSANSANTANSAGFANSAGSASSAGSANTAGFANSANTANSAGSANLLANVTLVRTDGPTLATGNNEAFDAFCPNGKQPLAGGGRTDATNVNNTSIESSRPVVPGNATLPGTGDTLQGWRIGVFNNSGVDIHPAAWVVCAG